MKKTGFTLSLLILSIAAISQAKLPIVKGYAYLRESLPGIVPKTVDEKGNEIIHENKPIATYELFLEYKKGNTIKPVKLWINGVPYRLRSEAITATPILYKRETVGNNFETDTLVKKTTYQVMRLLSDGELNPAPMTRQKDSGNKLVVEYYWKAKKYSYTIKDIRKLTPLILQ